MRRSDSRVLMTPQSQQVVQIWGPPGIPGNRVRIQHKCRILALHFTPQECLLSALPHL